MAGKGFTIPEEGHIVSITPPIDLNGVGATSDYFTMENYAHVDIIVTLGVTGAASNFLVLESTSSTGGSKTAIAFDYYAEVTAAGDTLGARTTATTTGFATSTNDGVIYVISLDASQLSDGYPYVNVTASDPSAATLYSAVAILSGSRYQQAVTPTAIT